MKSGFVYTASLTVSVAALVVINIFFFQVMGVNEYPSGNFITPGNNRTEWLFAIDSIPAILCLVALCGTPLSRIFALRIIKSAKKRGVVGVIPVPAPDGRALAKKLWGRALVLGFFVSNLCYLLASQEWMVDIMRAVRPAQVYMLPDPETMYQLFWVLCAPCAVFVVPTWILMDVGLVVASESNAYVDRATKGMYVLVKGYVGLGFIYNLIMLTVTWAVNSSLLSFAGMIQLLSPLIIICATLPGAVLVEVLTPRYAKGLGKTLAAQGAGNRLKLAVAVEQAG